MLDLPPAACHSEHVASSPLPLRPVGHGRRTVVYRGQRLGAREFARIQRLIRAHPELSGEALAHAVARHFQWTRPTGELAVSSCRLLLGRLARRGLLRLPAPQRPGNFRARRAPPAVEADAAREPGPAPTGPLVVRPIRREELAAWRAAMAQHHYLGEPQLVGEALRYVACLGPAWVAVLAWGPAALHNPPRDRDLGWDAATRARRLPWVVNNSRFLLLPGPRVPHLASRILAANLRRLRRDWETAFGHPVLWAETFVDVARFRGTCYRASNWRYLGDTRGFARRGATYVPHERPKAVFVYPLHRRARAWLTARVSPLERSGSEGPAMVTLDVRRLPLDGRGGLLEVLRRIADPRRPRGVRYSVLSILAIAVCATLAGAQSLVAIAQWAQEQSPRTLRRLRCFRGRAPSEPTIRRVLSRLDGATLDQRVGAWLAQQTAVAGQGVALDGKTLRGSAESTTPAVHLVGAVLHREGLVVAQHRVAEKTNEQTSVAPLLADCALTGAVVTGDAMFTQKTIATHLVEQKQADYLFTVKENQPTLRDDIVALQLDAFPPSAHDGRQGPWPPRRAGHLDERGPRRL